jgi:diketogulonate reductase-like aldo/keto reductase
MPCIGYGTWRCDPDKLQAAVVHALRVGYRHIDCAALYRNETIVGAGIAQAIAEGVCSRDQLFVCSKLA